MEAAGFAFKIAVSVNPMMAHASGFKWQRPRSLRSVVVSPEVLSTPQHSTQFVEAFWRRRERSRGGNVARRLYVERDG
jgi:hypothetical protein